MVRFVPSKIEDIQSDEQKSLEALPASFIPILHANFTSILIVLDGPYLICTIILSWTFLLANEINRYWEKI